MIVGLLAGDLAQRLLAEFWLSLPASCAQASCNPARDTHHPGLWIVDPDPVQQPLQEGLHSLLADLLCIDRVGTSLLRSLGAHVMQAVQIEVLDDLEELGRAVY
jgi:hypothetical protein